MADIGFNRLANEQSSYLKQHVDNPVHWWSWGPEALQRSKDENKPIFLSIGYSSCHWCKVMGMESFSDEQTAEFLNENFICIKVDREEHPDLDNYYQQACQLFTQNGGWPLSAFLLPDLRPYFVGTYFPKNEVKDGTSFMGLLSELKRAYEQEPEVVKENATKAFEALKNGAVPSDKVEFQGHFPPPNAVMDVLDQFKDAQNGGYGQAPKFAQFSFYEWALEQMLEGMITKEQGEHIIKSLERILMGGISDHTRGGIHRYATDETWTVPHFEKMLYDQAGYLRVLAKLSLLYPSPLVFDAIFNTLEYLHLEMLDENKFFFSAQGADSEGVEGLYFTFSEEEFEDAVNKADTEELNVSDKLEDIKKWFAITKEGNFKQGLNIITLDHNHAKEFFSSTNWEIVRKVRKSLLSERKIRIPPMTDNKGVASWNFQTLSALADVMQYCQVAPIKSAASQIFNQLVEGVYKNFLNSADGSMNIRHTTTRDTSLPYLEDYVFFAESQCRIYELSGNEVFKKNFYDTLMFIKDQFLDEENLLTRAKKSQDHELYPNQVYSSFDQSFKSATSTFIGLIRRAATLFNELDLLEDIKPLVERVTHEVLKNPASSGEALRSLTYPNEAYKTIKCPKAWLDKDEFANFISYFLPRFTFDYHEGEDEKWEISSIDQVELTGQGFENFVQTLKPNNEQVTEVQGE